MLFVCEINDLASAEKIRPEWVALLSQTEGATFMQSLEWLEVYWKHFGAGQKLRILLVLDHDEPVGILPLVVRKEKTRAGSFRFLTYPLDYWGSFYGPIGPRPAETLNAALAYIHVAIKDWDVLELRWVGGAETSCQCTAHAMKTNGMPGCQTLMDHTAVIDLQGANSPNTWDQYLASRSGKWRNNFKRWRRKLEKRGEVEHLRYRPLGSEKHDDDPRWDLYQSCLNIAEKSWQGSSQTGTTISHPSIEPYIRDTHLAAVRAGSLDLNLLLVDGQPAAFAYNYCQQGNILGLRIGYDAEFAHDGAGNLLYALVIKDSFARHDRRYDLGVGSLECKKRLQTALCPVYRYSHFPLTGLRPQLLRIKREFDHFMSTLETPSPDNASGGAKR